MSHPVRVRGLKRVYIRLNPGQARSHPVRVRGLKHQVFMHSRFSYVAPRAGAWIETIYTFTPGASEYVAPRAGAWIETGIEPLTGLQETVAPRAGAWIETCRKSRYK